MLLTELIEEVLIESGQFIVGDGSLCATQLDKNKLWILVRHELSQLQKYRPRQKRTLLSNVRTTYQFGRALEEEIPLWVSSCYPVNTYARISTLKSEFDEWSINDNPHLIIPRTFIYEYRKPVLHMSEAGDFEVMGLYPLLYTVTEDDGIILEVDMEIDKLEHTFTDMVLGKFMIALGRSRMSFTLDGLPIQTNAQDLVSEGREIYKEAEESLTEQSLWWESIGN